MKYYIIIVLVGFILLLENLSIKTIIPCNCNCFDSLIYVHYSTKYNDLKLDCINVIQNKSNIKPDLEYGTFGVRWKNTTSFETFIKESNKYCKCDTSGWQLQRKNGILIRKKHIIQFDSLK